MNDYGLFVAVALILVAAIHLAMNNAKPATDEADPLEDLATKANPLRVYFDGASWRVRHKGNRKQTLTDGASTIEEAIEDARDILED